MFWIFLWGKKLAFIGASPQNTANIRYNQQAN